MVEALGKGAVADADLYKAISDRVVAKAGDYSPADLAKILWGYGAAGVPDVKLTKAATAALIGKSGDATAKDLAQAVFALASMKR